MKGFFQSRLSVLLMSIFLCCLACEEEDAEVGQCLTELRVYRFQIDENSPPGAVVGQFPLERTSQRRFAILSGNLGETFSINVLTGKIVVQNNQLLDFERYSVFNLLIGIKGPDCKSIEAEILVQIGDLTE